ncbi:hypothetical protein IVB27_38595 [Bradyrhizobium sp. 197]|uniref:hypothetical protein n=1 Tax=Bradyrhizobium sp. 197 TaxID=2782663 RepID=UPI001FFBA716|nr:hypothetical protein [Bradyrhizobium sp. 197]MCK1480489.1 hypothetical protein [Bradyrhizobium sp. 197]
MTSSARHIPGEQFAIRSRKELFHALNEKATKAGAWLTSIPGARDVSLECLPAATLPSELEALGYRLTAEPDGQRMLPTTITEKFWRTSSGALVPLTADSTRPVSHVVHHAGLVTVERYSFRLP